MVDNIGPTKCDRCGFTSFESSDFASAGEILFYNLYNYSILCNYCANKLIAKRDKQNKTLTDKCFKKFGYLTDLLIDESDNQIKKWGIQTHTPFEWLTYTTEELGELAKAISEYEYRNGDKKQIVKEAIQTATLSLKIAEMYMEDK